MLYGAGSVGPRQLLGQLARRRGTRDQGRRRDDPQRGSLGVEGSRCTRIRRRERVRSGVEDELHALVQEVRPTALFFPLIAGRVDDP